MKYYSTYHVKHFFKAVESTFFVMTVYSQAMNIYEDSKTVWRMQFFPTCFSSQKSLTLPELLLFSGPIESLPFDLSSLWAWSQVKVVPIDSIFKRSNRNFLQCYLVRIASFEFYISKLFYFHFHVKWPFNVANWQSEILSDFPISFKNVNVPPESNLSFFLLVLCRYEYINVVFFVSHWIAMSNSCYNPFIYAIFSVSYSYRHL